MRIRWIILLSCMVICLAAVIAYSVKASKTDKPKVAVVFKEIETQYWQIVKAGVEQGFQDFGIDGKITAPESTSKNDTQVNVLKNALKEHPDVLIVSPDESPEVLAILQKFVEQNIPVLLLDTDAPLERKTAYIGTDNFDLGRKAGELLASQLQPGDEVAVIGGYLNSVVIGQRIAGAKFSLEAAGIKIVAEKVNIENEPLPVKQAMTAVLENHPDVKGVYATTDIMALNILEVLEKQGRDTPVIGADGIIEMVEWIEKGTLAGTVAQNPYDMGFIGVETAQRVFNGEKVQTLIDSGVDIITKDNAKAKLEFLREALQ